MRLGGRRAGQSRIELERTPTASRRAASTRHRIARTRLAAEPPTASAPAQAADEIVGSADPCTDATPTSRPSTASATTTLSSLHEQHAYTGSAGTAAEIRLLVVCPSGPAVITLTISPPPRETAEAARRGSHGSRDRCARPRCVRASAQRRSRFPGWTRRGRADVGGQLVSAADHRPRRARRAADRAARRRASIASARSRDVYAAGAQPGAPFEPALAAPPRAGTPTRSSCRQRGRRHAAGLARADRPARLRRGGDGRSAPR